MRRVSRTLKPFAEFGETRAGGPVALLLTVAIVACALIWINFIRMPSGLWTIDPDALRHEDGFAYAMNLDVRPCDGSSRSQLRLYEDGIRLGPAHALHADIREHGQGRFSHKNGRLRFAASDNSDPRTNGRVYTYKARYTLPGIVWLFVLPPFLLIGLPWSIQRTRDTAQWLVRGTQCAVDEEIAGESPPRFSARWRAILAVLGLAIGAGHVLHIHNERPVSDQRQYLAFGYNAVKHGVYSESLSESPSASFRREPLYPFLLVAGMLLHPEIHVFDSTIRCLVELEPGCEAGARAIHSLKVINIACMLAAAAMAASLLLRLTGSRVVALIGFLMVSLSGGLAAFSMRFFPEALAGLLMLVASRGLFVMASGPWQAKQAFRCGLIIGLLVHVKAIFYYFALFLIPLLFVFWLLRGVPGPAARNRSLVLAIGMGLIIVPWMVRNYVSCGAFSISGRSGTVLTIRANFNEMTPEEYRAAWLLFTPKTPWHNELMRRYVTPEIREALVGQNSYRNNALAMRAALREQFRGRVSEVDRAIRKDAVRRIRENPWGHVKTTPLFAARGSFAERGYGFAATPAPFDSLVSRWLGTPCLFHISGAWWTNVMLAGSWLVVIGWAAARRHWPLLAFLLPMVYYFGIHAAASHFIPRYGVPQIPVMVVCVGLVLHAVASAAWRRFRSTSADQAEAAPAGRKTTTL